MPLDRTRVIAVIRRYSELRAGPAPLDDLSLDRGALAQAAEGEGVRPDEVLSALRADPDLLALAQAAEHDALEPPDPGPYAAISRESPNARPGDLFKPREVKQ